MSARTLVRENQLHSHTRDHTTHGKNINAFFIRKLDMPLILDFLTGWQNILYFFGARKKALLPFEPIKCLPAIGPSMLSRVLKYHTFLIDS